MNILHIDWWSTAGEKFKLRFINISVVKLILQTQLILCPAVLWSLYLAYAGCSISRAVFKQPGCPRL